MKKLSVALLTTATVLAIYVDASAQQHVSVGIGSHVPAASSLEIKYTAKCLADSYELVVSPKKQTVLLNKNDLQIANLSSAKLSTILFQEFGYGKFSFKCPNKAVSIYFHGFVYSDKMPVSGLGYVVSIQDDGKVFDENPIQNLTIDQTIKIMTAD